MYENTGMVRYTGKYRQIRYETVQKQVFGKLGGSRSAMSKFNKLPSLNIYALHFLSSRWSRELTGYTTLLLLSDITV